MGVEGRVADEGWESLSLGRLVEDGRVVCRYVVCAVGVELGISVLRGQGDTTAFLPSAGMHSGVVFIAAGKHKQKTSHSRQTCRPW